MGSRFCCCGVKVGAIIVAYVELVLSLVSGIGTCVLLMFGIVADIFSGVAETIVCDDHSSETCDSTKTMLTVVIIVTIVRTILILVGAVCVHIGLKRNNPTWLLPLIIINSVMIGIICFGTVSSFILGIHWINSLGSVVDVALLILFTYALTSCSKFMKQERAMAAVEAGQNGSQRNEHESKLLE